VCTPHAFTHSAHITSHTSQQVRAEQMVQQRSSSPGAIFLRQMPKLSSVCDFSTFQCQGAQNNGEGFLQERRSGRVLGRRGA
jgi:hypothetical protein